MSRDDKVGCIIVLILLVLLASAVPGALKRHSCASLDVGTVEGCK